MSTYLDCSRCGKEYKYDELNEHECADVIALLARVAVLEKENKILETIARGCLGTLFAETYLSELRRMAKEG